MLVKYKGTNNSLQAYGYRFEKDKLVNVEDIEVLEKLKERDDFELMESQKEQTHSRRKSEVLKGNDKKKSRTKTDKKENITEADTKESEANADTGESETAE
ncbi:hypothetical protein [Brevibacillus laterosporus]|uniref:hypothetical protein n=1 Tax=Brevibacillus laterosporus TaxID=1465 RepID=UPI003D1CB799